MIRSIVIVILLVACKKQEAQPEPEATPAPTEGARGHSVTKVKSTEPQEGSAEATTPDKPTEAGSAGSAEAATEPTTATATADAATDDPKKKPPYRDDHGRVKGPGGPIYMGRGADCTPERDHCLRDAVWFATGEYRPGALFRATPVFEFEGKMWTFREEEFPPREYTWLFKTKVAKASDVQAGQPIVWLIRTTSADKVFLSNEHDALTSSRWDVGVVESVGSDFIRVKGWDANIPIDTVRVVTEKKKSG